MLIAKNQIKLPVHNLPPLRMVYIITTRQLRYVNVWGQWPAKQWPHSDGTYVDAH